MGHLRCGGDTNDGRYDVAVITTTRLWSLRRRYANETQPQPRVEGFRAARVVMSHGGARLTSVPARTPTQQDALASLAHDPRLVWARNVAAVPGLLSPIDPCDVPTNLVERITPGGLWTHQREAIDAITSQAHTVISTGTGSGKSACYQLPIAARLAADPLSTALVIEPTKALAHDQLRSFSGVFAEHLAMTHDGDSDVPRRQLARREARVLFTNPEMVHSSLLAHHTRWSRLLGHLDFVVIDEMHAIRGVFGSHVAHVIRRLRRVCAFHGAKPTFVLTSATISQAGDLAEALIGSEVVVIDNDTSPQGPRRVAVWDPTAQGRTQPSASYDTAELASHFVDLGHRVIGFCRARSTVENVASLTRQRVADPDRIIAYRGGYLASERRDLETRIATGGADAIFATSALELGVDIGELDTALINGFPGTVSSFRQQIGRVGRRGQPSTSILVCGNDQLDRWMRYNPDALLDRPAERVVINPSNQSILRPQLACAAHELPLDPMTDDRWWPNDLDAAVCDLARVDLVRPRNGRAVFADTRHPGTQISLRSMSSTTVKIETMAGTLIGTVEAAQAPSTVFAGARYLHQGVAYQVTLLDMTGRRAIVTDDLRGPCRSSALTDTNITILDTIASRPIGRVTAHFGTVRVTQQVKGYSVTRPDGKVIERGDLDIDPNEVVTQSMWLTFDTGELQGVLGSPARLGGSLHAAEHALIGMLPLVAICDRWDVGGLSTPRHDNTATATIFIHDGLPGGAGISRLAYTHMDSLAATTAELIDQCLCTDGCPSCVVSPKCGNGNTPLDRDGSIATLGLLTSTGLNHHGGLSPNRPARKQSPEHRKRR